MFMLYLTAFAMDTSAEIIRNHRNNFVLLIAIFTHFSISITSLEYMESFVLLGGRSHKEINEG